MSIGAIPPEMALFETRLHEKVGRQMGDRDKYREKLESLLDDWNADFDKLEAMLRNAGSDPKHEWDEVITVLRQHRYAANSERG